MNELSIEIDHSQTAFLPGETIRGRVRWHVEEIPKRACLRLLWSTQGKGTEDVGVVEERNFETAGAIGSEVFEFTAPPAPWSFSGKLISLIWRLEAVVDKECAHRDITISPRGHEILLQGDMIVDASPA